MADRPLINHITWIGPDGEWKARYFLPLWDHILKWGSDMKCPRPCEMEARCHPMVQDEQGAGHKLCTLTVIKAGLIKRKELI